MLQLVATSCGGCCNMLHLVAAADRFDKYLQKAIFILCKN